MQHLEEGMIHAWLDGALSADESARVEQHAKECAECAAMVADARGLIAGASRIVSALDVVPSGVIPKPSTSNVRTGGSVWRTLHLTPFRAALAASVMVAVASMFAVRGDREKVESIAVLRSTPAAGDPVPAATLPPALPGPTTSAKRDAVASTRSLESAREKERKQVSARDAADSAARFAEAPKVAAKAMDVA
ncbi:MAG TPA: zf-HC2 domain-containing protein, partial [Gemmatimonadaceae bacterium]